MSLLVGYAQANAPTPTTAKEHEYLIPTTRLMTTKEILLEIKILCISNGELHWGNLFDYLINKFDEKSQDFRQELRRIYAGMGSFNDLVLYKGGRPDTEENNKLNSLRSLLFETVIVNNIF